MRGKAAFAIGIALGYVLGARAGKARYEQLKRGATAVWQTPLVQRGAAAVRGAVDDGVEQAKQLAMQATHDAFTAATKRSTRKTRANAKQSSDNAAATKAADTGAAKR